MNLSAPTMIVWVIAVILGVLGILGVLAIAAIPYASYLLIAGFVLLVLATLLKGM